MDRTLILDEDGNAVITCNEDFTVITIMSGELIHRHGVRPAQKFSIGGIGAIEAVRDYLNSVCAKNALSKKLQGERKELVDEYIETETEETKSRIENINKKLINLKGNSTNGRRTL